MQQNKSLRDAAHRLMPVVSTYKVVHDVGGDFTSDDEHEVLTVYMYAVHSMTTGPIYADMTLPDRKQLKFQINVIQAKTRSLQQPYGLAHSIQNVQQFLSEATGQMENPINGKKYRVEFQAEKQLRGWISSR